MRAQLSELRAEQSKLTQQKVDLENQLEAEQVGALSPSGTRRGGVS